MDMSGGGSINVSQEDLAKLTPRDHQELVQFITNESQKASIQATVHDLTETCFKKCITGSISAGKLASKEQACMSNCVDRFMDSNLAVLKHLQLLQSNQ